MNAAKEPLIDGRSQVSDNNTFNFQKRGVIPRSCIHFGLTMVLKAKSVKMFTDRVNAMTQNLDTSLGPWHGLSNPTGNYQASPQRPRRAKVVQKRSE